MTRQRAPQPQDRTLVACTACQRRGVNKDHPPASSALSDCCPECGGLGLIDDKLGALPAEQIIMLFRNRMIEQQRLHKGMREQLADVQAAWAVLSRIGNRPHPASEAHGPGHLGATRSD